MAAEGDAPKWEGKATAKLLTPTAKQVWPLLEDFFGFQKWLPTIDTCRRIDDGATDDGLVRYCATTLPDGVVKWCHEKLVDIDPKDKWLSYEVLDNNIGVKTYESTIKVVPIKGGDDHDEPIGCQIEWSFLADPVEGLTCEGLVGYLEISLQAMAHNMGKALDQSA